MCETNFNLLRLVLDYKLKCHEVYKNSFDVGNYFIQYNHHYI